MQKFDRVEGLGYKETPGYVEL